jgi:hypothetical protein
VFSVERKDGALPRGVEMLSLPEASGVRRLRIDAVTED